MRRLQVLLLTLGDTAYEQQRLNDAVARLNREHGGAVVVEVSAWTGGFYPRDEAFQAQLRTVECDLIIAIFRVALAVELPAPPERMSDGSLYPSNTAYEVLAAIAAKRAGGLPPVHIFRHPPATNTEPAGGAPPFDIVFHDFVSTDDFERQLTEMLRDFVGEAPAAEAAGEPPFAVPPVVEPTVPPAALVAPVAPGPAAREWTATEPPAIVPAPRPNSRRFRAAAVAAAVFAVLALIAWDQAIVARHREKHAEASLAELSQRLAEAERRSAATAHSLDETARNIEAARARLKLADNLVVAMVREMAQVLRTSEGMPPAAIREVLGKIDSALAPLFAEGGGDPDIVVAHAGILGQFGQIYLAIGDGPDGRKAAEQAVAMLRSLTERDPSNGEWQRDLGVSLRIAGSAALRAGDNDGARTAYEEALAIGRRAAAGKPETSPEQRDLMSALTGTADARLKTGDAAGALPLYEQAAAIVRRLADGDPQNSEWIRGTAILLSKIADAKARTGDRDGALATFEQALVVQREIAATAPDDADAKRYIAIILGRIGDLREEKGDTAGALAADDEGLALRRALAAQAGSNRQAQIDLTIGLYKVAGMPTGDRRRKALQEALAILQRLDHETKLNDEQVALASTIRQALNERR
jgi:tetratricopeptide (TPR) repeat protein